MNFLCFVNPLKYIHQVVVCVAGVVYLIPDIFADEQTTFSVFGFVPAMDSYAFKPRHVH